MGRVIRPERPLAPAGTLAVGGGLLVLGATTYAFLVVSARLLSAEDFAILAVLYTATNVVGGGLYYPVEQQVSRLTAGRRVVGLGSGPVLLRSAAVCGAVVLASLLCIALIAGPLAWRLYGGDRAFLLLTGVGLTTSAMSYLVRGALAGAGRFACYGAQLAVEGTVRLGGVVILAVTGWNDVLLVAALIPLAPAAGVLVALRRPRRLVEPGPSIGYREVASSLGLLTGAGTAAQVLANAGPLLVAALATAAQQESAGVFLAAMVLTRIPVFLFAAVQASFVPQVAAAAAAKDWGGVRRSIASLTRTVVMVSASATVLATAAGPPLLQLVFGERFVVSSLDLLLLSLSAAAFLLAQVVGQALVALGRLRAGLIGWLIGLATLTAGAQASADLQLRVEIGLLLGSAGAAACHALVLSRVLRTNERSPLLTAA